MEVTREENLSLRGDCIVGVRSEKGAKSLSVELKQTIRNSGHLVVLLTSDEAFDFFTCMGTRELPFSDETKIIFRKSSFISPATVGIRCSKSAGDLNRELISNLKNGKPLTVHLLAFTAQPEDEEVLRVFIDLLPGTNVKSLKDRFLAEKVNA
ncbi:hypothetical protein HS7_11110 [Sulfolobales archaeon HS-7]|nr:hypothetical protein HS7_11110 [Sulfolobales archaeon HS-7]